MIPDKVLKDHSQAADSLKELLDSTDASKASCTSQQAALEDGRSTSRNRSADTSSTTISKPNEESSVQVPKPVTARDRFLSVTNADRRSMVGRWASMSLKDPKDLQEFHLRDFPGSEAMNHHVCSAGDVTRRLGIHRAYAAVRNDAEFQNDVSVPHVMNGVEHIRQNPSKYEEIAASDARIRYVLERLRRLHAAVISLGQKTVSLDDAITTTDASKRRSILQESSMMEERLEKLYTAHVNACIAAGLAESSEEAEVSAEEAFALALEDIPSVGQKGVKLESSDGVESSSKDTRNRVKAERGSTDIFAGVDDEGRRDQGGAKDFGSISEERSEADEPMEGLLQSFIIKLAIALFALILSWLTLYFQKRNM